MSPQTPSIDRLGTRFEDNIPASRIPASRIPGQVL